MDKIEVTGYGAAGICLAATLAVFFFWIMPNNAQIKTNLASIDRSSNDLKKFVAEVGEMTATPPEAYPKSVTEIEKQLDKALVTPAVTATLKDTRKTISAHSTEVIQTVVSAHEVTPPPPPADLYRELQKIRAEMKQLFDEKKVPVPPAKSLSLPEENEVNISISQFTTARICNSVLGKLLRASTTINISKGKVGADGKEITTEPVRLSEGVNQVLQFVYFDEKIWEARQKLFDNEAEKVRGKPSGVPDTTKPLPCKRTGFRLVFQTLPVHVNAALASLENMDGHLVTIKRTEVIRANNAYYRKAEFDGTRIEVPQPYRDGNVQVTVEAELVGFNPKAGSEMSARLYKAQ